MLAAKYADPMLKDVPPIHFRYESMETKYVNVTTNVRISSRPNLSQGDRYTGRKATVAVSVLCLLGSVTLQKQKSFD